MSKNVKASRSTANLYKNVLKDNKSRSALSVNQFNKMIDVYNRGINDKFRSNITYYGDPLDKTNRDHIRVYNSRLMMGGSEVLTGGLNLTGGKIIPGMTRKILPGMTRKYMPAKIVGGQLRPGWASGGDDRKKTLAIRTSIIKKRQKMLANFI